MKQMVRMEEPSLRTADGNRRGVQQAKATQGECYFRDLLSTDEEIAPSIRPLLKLSRETIARCQKTEYALVSSLQSLVAAGPRLAVEAAKLATRQSGLWGKLSAAASDVLVVAYNVDADCVAAWPQSSETKAPA